MTRTRIFGETDQQSFAQWSGDTNPMHMDPLAARRTAAGAPVVHGIHLLLWALDQGLDATPGAGALAVRADFRKFVFVGQPVTLTRGTDRQGRLTIRLSTDDGTVATIRAHPSEAPVCNETAGAEIWNPGEPASPTLAEMRTAEGRLVPEAFDPLGEVFPRLATRLSIQAVAEIAQLSRLVGMICPGLNSIFAGLDLTVGQGNGEPGIGFRTIAVDERFRLVRMVVGGSAVHGAVEAFVRPEPVAALSMEEAKKLVGAGRFGNRRALVVGGSRGLGAVTAKLLAAGGADVTITYATGRAEAAGLCEEIALQGCGTCRAIPLDVCQPLPRQLETIERLPTHVYYFATPRIFLQKEPDFDRSTLDRFIDFYVGGFDELCTYFAGQSPEPIDVFYPSSVAVDDRPQGLAEYAMAKAAGEILCADLMHRHSNLRIKVERLPRVLTDQTATIYVIESASAQDVLLPLLED